MKKHKLRIAACIMLVGTVLAAFVAIAAEVGSEADPLVTLSYLEEVFLTQILESVDEKLGVRNEQLAAELTEKIEQAKEDILLGLGSSYGDEDGGMALSFTAVTLAPGQTLYGGAGCEVLLRSGSATCVSEGMSAPGLVDTTGGTTINHGVALAENHLYMMTDQRGVRAEEETVILVRGKYSID